SSMLFVETDEETPVVTGGIIGLETAGSTADRRIMSFGCKSELPLRYGTGIALPFFRRRNLVGRSEPIPARSVIFLSSCEVKPVFLVIPKSMQAKLHKVSVATLT